MFLTQTVGHGLADRFHQEDSDLTVLTFAADRTARDSNRCSQIDAWKANPWSVRSFVRSAVVVPLLFKIGKIKRRTSRAKEREASPFLRALIDGERREREIIKKEKGDLIELTLRHPTGCFWLTFSSWSIRLLFRFLFARIGTGWWFYFRFKPKKIDPRLSRRAFTHVGSNRTQHTNGCDRFPPSF